VALLVLGCASYQEVTIETPIQAKLDVSPFQRVLVAGFVAGGSEDVDANNETVRLLRSQLRTKSNLKVIESDVLPLAELAQQQAKEPTPVAPADTAIKPVPQVPPLQQQGQPPQQQAPPPPQQAPPPQSQQPTQQQAQPAQQPPGEAFKSIKDERDLQAYDQIFANVGFWKKLGEEFQSPLIVTGTVLFTPLARSGFVNKDQEMIDAMGVRSVTTVRTYQNRKGFQLKPKFIFIDGRTGTVIYSETFLEETLYNQEQNTPPLSSYFELMDRLIPRFLSTLSSQKIRGTRVLLK
jgi:hypothetical protein